MAAGWEVAAPTHRIRLIALPFFHEVFCTVLGVFLDTETSGLDPFSCVPLEVAIVIVDLVTAHTLASYETMLQVSQDEWLAADPHSLEINGFTQQDLDRGVTRQKAAGDIESLFSRWNITNDTALFICQNPSFDRPFFAKIVPAYTQERLNWPYHWLDLASMYWAKRGCAEQKLHSFGIKLSKDVIAASLNLPKESSPHRAMNGVNHLILCYTHLVGF